MNFDKQGQPSGTGNSDFYLEKLERGLEQVHEGLGIIKTMEELEAIEKTRIHMARLIAWQI